MLRECIALVAVWAVAAGHMPADQPHSVFTVSHTRSFRKDLMESSMGSGNKVAYTSYTYPEGARDALYIFNNGHGFGASRVNTKETYARVFGWGQDYNQLRGNGKGVGSRLAGAVRIRNIIIDWKLGDGDLGQARSTLDELLGELAPEQTFVKVPASYLCRLVQGSPYILGLKNAKNIIVEMYGESPTAYATGEQIFTAEASEQPTTGEYPSTGCPQYPSYAMLLKAAPSMTFYIEKTLQSFEPGYLGAEFDSLLAQHRQLYGADKNVFYDSFPPNLIPV